MRSYFNLFFYKTFKITCPIFSLKTCFYENKRWNKFVWISIFYFSIKRVRVFNPCIIVFMSFSAHHSLRLFYSSVFPSFCLSVCLLVSWSCFLSALIRPFWEVTTLSLLDGLCGFEFRSIEKSGEKRKRSAIPIAIPIFLLPSLKIYCQHFIYSIGKLHRVKTSFKLLWQEINIIKIVSLFSNVVLSFSFVSNIFLKTAVWSYFVCKRQRRKQTDIVYSLHG